MSSVRKRRPVEELFPQVVLEAKGKCGCENECDLSMLATGIVDSVSVEKPVTLIRSRFALDYLACGIE